MFWLDQTGEHGAILIGKTRALLELVMSSPETLNQYCAGDVRSERVFQKFLHHMHRDGKAHFRTCNHRIDADEPPRSIHDGTARMPRTELQIQRQPLAPRL